nr:site-specific integrase [Brevibacillus borstelensis]
MQYLSSIDRSHETITGYRKDLIFFTRFLEAKYNVEPYIDEITANDIEDYLTYCQYRFNFPQNYRLKIPHFCRYWLFTSAGSGRKKPAFFFSLMR